MRIVVDTRYVNDRFPGIGRYASELARALASLGGDDELLLLHNPFLRDSSHDLTSADLPPRCRLVPCPVPRFLPAELLRLPGVVRGLGPDLFHSPFHLAPLGLGCPVVITVFDLIPLDRRMRWLDRLVFRTAIRLASAGAAAVLTASHTVARDLGRRHPALALRVHVAPLAAGSRFRPPPADAVAALRHRLGLPRRYVLHLGSHLPHKRVDLLVEAWAHLGRGDRSGRSRTATLVLAGPEGPETPSLRATVERLGLAGAVRFIGPVAEDDLPCLYGGAEACVLPSDAEGFGLPVLEAMACGTPVIISAIDVLEELVGAAAIRFEPGDAEALAAAVARVLEDPAAGRRLSELGLLRARDYSWEATARATRRAYREAARGDPA